jgi:probable HAF family extracellular repeat protein
LGFLPGLTESHASGVSADGSVVVGYSGAGTGAHSFRWTAAGGMVDLGVLAGGGWGAAYGVSADGSVVVGYSSITGGYGRAFRWTAGGGMVDLGVLPFEYNSSAYGASADGSVVVGENTGGDPRAFRWTAAGGMVSLGVLPGDGASQANGVSADGSVVVGGCFNPAYRAFRWTAAGGMADLGDLPGANPDSAVASNVSADGAVVVGADYTPSGDRAFRWTAASGMVSLGVLPGESDSEAYGVSADGAVVVGHNYAPFGFVAFRWTAAGGMRDLRDVLVTDYGLGSQLAGWTLTEATACSPDGRSVVGEGTDPAGNTEAWIARFDAPPQVTATQVNDGSAQRSRVTSLQVTFSTQVSFATTPGAAFTLTRNSDSASVGLTATASVVNGVTVVTLNAFTGSATEFGSLADGRYTLTAIASQISAGGQPMASDYHFGDAQGLFRLFGDVNGDRTVNGLDFGFFKNAFGTQAGDSNYLSYLDFNGDGVINGFDLGQFRTRFGTMLP